MSIDTNQPNQIEALTVEVKNLNNGWKWREARVRELTTEVAQLKELLKRCEWVGPATSSIRGFDICPCCRARRRFGHTPDCALAAAIKDA